MWQGEFVRLKTTGGGLYQESKRQIEKILMITQESLGIKCQEEESDTPEQG